jgi:hypothetical protein
MQDYYSFLPYAGHLLAQIIHSILLFLSTVPFSLTVIFLVAAVVAALQIPYLGSLAALPYFYGKNILTFLGLVRRDATWCVVYDSKTKLPIDPAYVTVRDMQGVEISNIITDINGRFTLLLPRGLYKISANKTNYVFPSVTMAHAKTDGKYTNLYFGSIIDIEDVERSVAISIPMDPVQEDWNQAEKKRKRLFHKFDSANVYFSAARFYTILALLIAVVQSLGYSSQLSWHRLEAVIVLALLIFWHIWHHRQYPHSFVIDEKTKLPLSFAKVSIYSLKTKNKVSQKITSFEGQFTCLLSRGTYYVTIEKRDGTGKYQLVHTSRPFSVTNGYMGKQFKV